MNLVLIRGLPGSGKSTYAATAYPDYVHIESDQYFINELGEYKFDAKKLNDAHYLCYKRTKYALIYRANVVVSNTFTTIKEMKKYHELRELLPGLSITIVECTGNYGSIHDVPLETLKKMRNRWQLIPEHWSVTQIRIPESEKRANCS